METVWATDETNQPPLRLRLPFGEQQTDAELRERQTRLIQCLLRAVSERSHAYARRRESLRTNDPPALVGTFTTQPLEVYLALKKP